MIPLFFRGRRAIKYDSHKRQLAWPTHPHQAHEALRLKEEGVQLQTQSSQPEHSESTQEAVRWELFEDEEAHACSCLMHTSCLVSQNTLLSCGMV